MAHPLAFDALIATGVLFATLCAFVTVAKPPDGGPGFGKRDLPVHSLVLLLVGCGALVLRRRFPMPVLFVVSCVSLTEMILGYFSHVPQERHPSVLILLVVALFTVGYTTDRPTTWRVGLATTVVFTPAAMVLGAQPWYQAENLGVFAWTGLAAAAGEALRSRRAVVDAIRERAERAERTRDEEARRRVADERMRIARELHDVVAHHIALVNVQAGVASHVMDTRPDQAKEALAHIRQASRRALGELQTTVGLLRQQDEPIAPTEPVRGLAVLDELVDGFAKAGMDVSVHAPAAHEPLPSAVDLAAYRVVQEALTNVHKHAGPEAVARVRIVRGGVAADPGLDITVDDDGPPGEAPEAEGEKLGSGHGLTGMRERAAALSGTCEAGPVPGGGFRVRVTLPLRTPRPAEPEAAARITAARGRCL
ncbi:sensor histidine kinase [Streptomyces radicis]|uniref:histidine kinase n=1 Tax=Streptomyces radicis TaxID=1750517 RepID=A0A3A9WG97_9ACTN|nr:sensor histidine kinase [Streptomyces radicis]RKN12261.1 sensor histidine kinase [Streptomyces radicis]RKN26064.1 sensor histidine kinase [Streptomyces radicis]